MVKIFTMVKDECDIVKDWILYHGYLFGFNNIFIIDNYSTDGTFEIINEFKEHIHIFREHDYKLKGIYMTRLINKFSNVDELSFPVDIDEFIVLYNKEKNVIQTDKNIILNYLLTLPKIDLYKMNYIISNPTEESGFKQATVESKYGEYCNYKGHAKSFINMTLYNNVIDHGNHIFKDYYFLSDLCLIHFHERNLEQIKKKIYNNCVGLGHNINLDELKLCKNIDGIHHIEKMILILENNYKLNCSSYDDTNVNLIPFSNKVKELNYDYKNFNWKKYIDNYVDLYNAGINDEKKAWTHWYSYGKGENRKYS